MLILTINKQIYVIIAHINDGMERFDNSALNDS
jgi:hypothetical protein